MKIKDARELDDYGILDQVNPGEVVQFKNEREDGDIIFWVKTDNETGKKCHCVNIETGELEWFGLDKKCFILNISAVIHDPHL